jgi:chromosome segregation ATPase
MGEVAELQRAVTAAAEVIKLTFENIENLEKALARSKTNPGGLDSELETLKQRLYELDEALSGNRSRSSMGEPRVPTVAGRLRVASMTDGRSDYGPTATHRRALEIAAVEFGDIETRLRTLIDVDLPALETRMEAAGVPWTPGRPLPEVR